MKGYVKLSKDIKYIIDSLIMILFIFVAFTWLFSFCGLYFIIGYFVGTEPLSYCVISVFINLFLLINRYTNLFKTNKI